MAPVKSIPNNISSNAVLPPPLTISTSNNNFAHITPMSAASTPDLLRLGRSASGGRRTNSSSSSNSSLNQNLATVASSSSAAAAAANSSMGMPLSAVPANNTGDRLTPPATTGGPNYHGSWLDLSDDEDDQPSTNRFSMFVRRSSHRKSSPTTPSGGHMASNSVSSSSSGHQSPTKKVNVMNLFHLRRSRSRSDGRSFL
ncbi:hypothetical protein H4219_001404 [Mycoemilia scoparia]|uniref:Uncharacterized protein n=1 Tax=Mycoemilia scoparia TaxID=417184 RepID=A0A9W8A120_9FUNG|nr:hypothetical protein H4219_001404 [Mycoemilia scoparia]